MRLRNKKSPLLLLLLPGLAAALTPQNPARRQILEVDSPAAAVKKEYDAAALALGATPSPIAASAVKPVVGTKDAPVDGLDGKPHAGPFVDIAAGEKTKPNKKLAPEVEDLAKPLPTSLKKLGESGASIPEKNDGVMDDTNRVAPKKGTTGTEGGVSERTRKDKSLEAQLGEGAEKTVEPPKEAPPLPHSEEDAIVKGKSSVEGDKAKDKTVTLTGKPKGAQGLEVRLSPFFMSACAARLIRDSTETRRSARKTSRLVQRKRARSPAHLRR